MPPCFAALLPNTVLMKHLHVLKDGDSRRSFLLKLGMSSLVVLPLGAFACSRPLVCTDMAGLSPEDQEKRRQLGYKEPTPEPAKHCDNCDAFTAAAKDKCGACSELKGPVHPQGFCTAWREKP